MQNPEEIEAQKKAAVSRSVLESIGLDSIRSEVREEIRKKKSKFSEFFKHPGVLLILGFLLTTGLGTYLTARYQSNEWFRQQSFLSNQRYVTEKQALADEATKAIIETVSAADDTLYLFYWKTTPSDAANRQKNWSQSSSKWRNTHDAISLKLSVYFENGEIRPLFEEIVSDRYEFSRGIDDFIEDYNKNVQKLRNDKKSKKFVDDTVARINKLRQKVATFTQRMTQEIIADRKPEEKSIFSFL